MKRIYFVKTRIKTDFYILMLVVYNTKLMAQYDYAAVLVWLEKKGEGIYGKGFKILETDYPILFKLLAYFLQDEAACFQYNLDLGKGILLSGPVGCGKTTLMHLMKTLPSAKSKFYVKGCRDISFEFIQDGYEVIAKYSKGKHYPEPKVICFDDLGTENNLKYFGNECNVMAEILLSRYDLFVSKKITTHITTNLSASEIESVYGNRVRSRLRSMFNLIAFDKTTKDKR
jgi:DNA replication protein DnaC